MALIAEQNAQRVGLMSVKIEEILMVLRKRLMEAAWAEIEKRHLGYFRLEEILVRRRKEAKLKWFGRLYSYSFKRGRNLAKIQQFSRDLKKLKFRKTLLSLKFYFHSKRMVWNMFLNIHNIIENKAKVHQRHFWKICAKPAKPIIYSVISEQVSRESNRTKSLSKKRSTTNIFDNSLDSHKVPSGLGVSNGTQSKDDFLNRQSNFNTFFNQETGAKSGQHESTKIVKPKQKKTGEEENKPQAKEKSGSKVFELYENDRKQLFSNPSLQGTLGKSSQKQSRLIVHPNFSDDPETNGNKQSNKASIEDANSEAGTVEAENEKDPQNNSIFRRAGKFTNNFSQDSEISNRASISNKQKSSNPDLLKVNSNSQMNNRYSEENLGETEDSLPSNRRNSSSSPIQRINSRFTDNDDSENSERPSAEGEKLFINDPKDAQKMKQFANKFSSLNQFWKPTMLSNMTTRSRRPPSAKNPKRRQTSTLPVFQPPAPVRKPTRTSKRKSKSDSKTSRVKSYVNQYISQKRRKNSGKSPMKLSSLLGGRKRARVPQSAREGQSVLEPSFEASGYSPSHMSLISTQTNQNNLAFKDNMKKVVKALLEHVQMRKRKNYTSQVVWNVDDRVEFIGKFVTVIDLFEVYLETLRKSGNRVQDLVTLKTNISKMSKSLKALLAQEPAILRHKLQQFKMDTIEKFLIFIYRKLELENAYWPNLPISGSIFHFGASEISSQMPFTNQNYPSQNSGSLFLLSQTRNFGQNRQMQSNHNSPNVPNLLKNVQSHHPSSRPSGDTLLRRRFAKQKSFSNSNNKFYDKRATPPFKEISTQYIHTESLVINNHLTNKIRNFRNPGYSLTNFCALLNIKLRFKIKKKYEAFFALARRLPPRPRIFGSGISRRILRMFFRLIRKNMDFKLQMALKLLRMNRINVARSRRPNLHPRSARAETRRGMSPSWHMTTDLKTMGQFRKR